MTIEMAFIVGNMFLKIWLVGMFWVFPLTLFYKYIVRE